MASSTAGWIQVFHRTAFGPSETGLVSSMIRSMTVAPPRCPWDQPDQLWLHLVSDRPASLLDSRPTRQRWLAWVESGRYDDDKPNRGHRHNVPRCK